MMEQENAGYVASVGQIYATSGEEIAETLSSRLRKSHPSESEHRSWKNSIPVLANILHRAGLDALTLVLEYQTPIGERIDAVLLGERRATEKPLVLIFELKQWSVVRPCGHDCCNVSVCMSAEHDYFEDRRHPFVQANTYAEHLKLNHSGVCDGQVEIECKEFLHNLENKEPLFQSVYSRYAKFRNELYAKGEADRLVTDLRALFTPAVRKDVEERFLNGVYTLGKSAFRNLKMAQESKKSMVMLDDQQELILKIRPRIRVVFRPDAGKHLIIISGAPGTGKSILGLHAVYIYCVMADEMGLDPGHKGCVFTLPKSRTLQQVIQEDAGVPIAYLDAVTDKQRMVVVDEAHRIENVESTMEKLFRNVNLVIVFQDDRQRIRVSEEGTAANFRAFAKKYHISCENHSLISQKRAGYLGNYLFKLDKLFYNCQEQTLDKPSSLKLCCWDDLNELDRHLHHLFSEGHHVKWYAPFCWKWSKSAEKEDIVISQPSGQFKKAWNPQDAQYDWYLGQSEEDLEQVGCIYTAQGLEYDDIGVIWWDDLFWEEDTYSWRIHPEKIVDDAFRGYPRHVPETEV